MFIDRPYRVVIAGITIGHYLSARRAREEAALYEQDGLVATVVFDR